MRWARNKSLNLDAQNDQSWLRLVLILGVIKHCEWTAVFKAGPLLHGRARRL